MIRWYSVILLACLLTAGGCASLPKPLSPEDKQAAEQIRHHMKIMRDRFFSAGALTDVTTQSGGRLKLWPQLTAIAHYDRPNRYTLTGHTLWGEELFRWESQGRRYRFKLGNELKMRTGKIGGRGSGGAISRMLSQLTHLLDGLLGVNIEGQRLRPIGDAGWEVPGRFRFTFETGRVTSVTLLHHRRDPVRILFSDWRPAGPIDAPYQMLVYDPDHGVVMTVKVREWSLTPATRELRRFGS